jgi:hypothetical protein
MNDQVLLPRGRYLAGEFVEEKPVEGGGVVE